MHADKATAALGAEVEKDPGVTAGPSASPVALDPKNRTILVKVDPSAIEGLTPAKTLDAFPGSEPFAVKAELHITAAGFPIGKEIDKAIKADKAKGAGDLEDKIKELVALTDWSYTLTNESYYVTKNKQIDAGGGQKKDLKAESIIVLVDMPGLAEFHQKLGALIGKEIKTPPAHVTLYTRGDPSGIGFASVDQWNDAKHAEKVKL